MKVKAAVAGLAMVAGTVITAAPAQATWNDPHVNLSGHLDCGGAQEATWVWYEASNGERDWADTSVWTRVNRWVPGVLKLVEVKSYRINLTNVSKDGTQLTVKVGCKGVLGGRVKEYQTSFGVNRPTFGRSATRHICYDAPLGCIW
ncbi:hypothetical protein [Amycolatopsis sp. 195334CR]|uniref:hypothetical protein n=1 Tax=Amycolatopsis sp. 195334CR TaxID=2814588 RepID=UPI001A900DE0|nr:hypothetical protein [Amycolatopsis sp. 195334CR]MBN6040014.1 hypothetical protein [Amycolatopsis sp. 195334CR]